MRTAPHHNPAQEGLSLAGAALLLVAIGLISGGILYGKELHQQALARMEVAQLEHINQAVLGFREKFNCLPGDCAVLEGSDAAGNADGIIGCAGPSPGECLAGKTGGMAEYVNAWHHLSATHFLSGAYEQYAEPKPHLAGIASPASYIPTGSDKAAGWALRAEAHVSNGRDLEALAKHHLELGRRADLPKDAHAAFSAVAMQRLDAKLDDGLPFAGSMRAWTLMHVLRVPAYIATTGSGGKEAAVCVDSDPTPAQYNIAYEGSDAAAHCSALIKAAF